MVRSIRDEAQIALGGLRDAASSLRGNVLRLGVTGLSRSGKTVFITALVHALLHGARLPLFNVQAQGRLARAWLEPQPDDRLPRFAYEDHIAALTGPDRHWPEGTQRMSQLRLTLAWTGKGLIARAGVPRQLHLDIIDYPGEWLLDLPLLGMSYAAWSAATLEASRQPLRAGLAAAWHAHLATLDPDGPADEQAALTAARLFTSYLASGRGAAHGLSALPPGRFLMPGDLAGSPLLTFAPLGISPDHRPRRGSLAAMMARRYDAYVREAVRPFFFDHFARLDRQIVLADALSALNAGPAAVDDLATALQGVLACFRQGGNSLATRILGRRIDRILFAATKADLLHHSSHDRLESILRLIVAEAERRARFHGAATGVAALAALRATREATVRQNGEDLPCIVGTPEAGEMLDGISFDGSREAALFPGDLPADPEAARDGRLTGAVRFLKLRPPRLDAAPGLARPALLPHIRLDKALEFLLGDKLT